MAGAGAIRLLVRLAPPGALWPAQDGVLQSVHDDGKAIARAHISRRTERAYPPGVDRSRAVGGSGLGLAIVGHIVNRHRGQLLSTARKEAARQPACGY